MKEKLSALFDGDADEETSRMLFERIRRDAVLRGEWEAYCLLGDVIRSGAQPDMGGFAARVMSRLDDEPTVLVPRRMEDKRLRRILRHRLLPVAASVMGVLAVGSVVAALSDKGQPTVVVVVSPPQAGSDAVVQTASSRAADPAPPLATNITRRDYLAAHQAMAGGGPMPAAVQYVRTVSAQAEE
ncbi:MAG: sigma-E factor negative regulatory protein [Azoarcus sp.]|jgi:sigma-E factor negative regulatory protein RseA|nr:sigma-E factor negative regulatory protein [Azoarcus sp.]